MNRITTNPNPEPRVAGFPVLAMCLLAMLAIYTMSTPAHARGPSGFGDATCGKPVIIERYARIKQLNEEYSTSARRARATPDSQPELKASRHADADSLYRESQQLEFWARQCARHYGNLDHDALRKAFR